MAKKAAKKIVVAGWGNRVLAMNHAVAIATAGKIVNPSEIVAIAETLLGFLDASDKTP
jgi:hypothetical protein